MVPVGEMLIMRAGTDEQLSKLMRVMKEDKEGINRNVICKKDIFRKIVTEHPIDFSISFTIDQEYPQLEFFPNQIKGTKSKQL